MNRALSPHSVAQGITPIRGYQPYLRTSLVCQVSYPKMTASFLKRSAMASSQRRPKFARQSDCAFPHSALFCEDNPSMLMEPIASIPLIVTQDDVESEKGLTAKLSGANEKALPPILTDSETRPYRQNSVLQPVLIARENETWPYRRESAKDDKISLPIFDCGSNKDYKALSPEFRFTTSFDCA